MLGRHGGGAIEVGAERLDDRVRTEREPELVEVESGHGAGLLDQRVDRVELAPAAHQALSQPAHIHRRIALLGGGLDRQARRVRATRWRRQPQTRIDRHPAPIAGLQHLGHQRDGIAKLAGHPAHHIGDLEAAGELVAQLPQGGLERPGPRTGRIGVVVRVDDGDLAQNRGHYDEHAPRHHPQRPLPARGPDRGRWDVDGLPRHRRDAPAPGRDQADAPRDRLGFGPARAVPPRGARGGAAVASAHRWRDRLWRGRRPSVHRVRVRRGRDAQGAHPPHGPAAHDRGRRVCDRDRARARRRPRPPHRAPRRQAPERADRRGGIRQGHGLRDRPHTR